MESSNGQFRMQWVDGMRGFSMIIVVLGHVLASCGIGSYESFFSSIIVTFMLPLFFFISGFFSFRAIEWWNRKRVGDILKRKLQAQILCTFVFMPVYQYYMWGGVNIEHGFGGYWFTIVLFQMYLLYLILPLLSRAIRLNIVIPSLLILSIVGIVCLVVYSRDSWIWNFLCWENLCKYFQFFTFGIICAKFKDKVFSLLANKTFVSLVTIGWLLSLLIYYSEDIRVMFPLPYSFIHDILARYLSLIIVISIFFASSTYFTRDLRLPKTLCYIGQRTLDIYMLHYFFIPDMKFLGTWLLTGNRIIFQLSISLAITAVIISLCLLTSYLIRRSNALERWLFGVKQRVAC